MSYRLVPLVIDGNAEELATELAKGFGGDPEPVREIFAQTQAMYAAAPREDPWGSYVAYAGRDAVGLGAFKSAPDSAGAVEIAYITFPAYERRGHATATAGALTRIAVNSGASLVVAHTLPQDNPSTRALRRNGFECAGEVVDPDDGPVWRWEKR